MSANRSAPATHDFAPSWLRIPQSDNSSSLAWQRNNSRAVSAPSASDTAAFASVYTSGTRRAPASSRKESATSKQSVGQQSKLLIKESNRNTGNLKEEDFPRLSDGRLASAANGCQGPWGRSSHQKNLVTSSADHRCTPDSAENASLQLGNAPGKVYRAQINKGMVSRRQHFTLSQLNGVLLDNQQFDHKQASDPVDIPNGRLAAAPSASGDMHMPLEVTGHTAPLSSSLEKEQRLLREMGWKEDDYENCEISEAECQGLPNLLIKAKAERERLRLRCLPNLSKLQLASSSTMCATPASAVSPKATGSGQLPCVSEAEVAIDRASSNSRQDSICGLSRDPTGNATDAYDSHDELASSSSGNSDTE